jgi:hypothetical protein
MDNCIVTGVLQSWPLSGVLFLNYYTTGVIKFLSGDSG